MLKFALCHKYESAKASIPQIVFQAIVASFYPRKPAFLRQFLRGIMAKNFTALNKEERLLRCENLRLKFEVFMEKIFTALNKELAKFFPSC